MTYFAQKIDSIVDLRRWKAFSSSFSFFARFSMLNAHWAEFWRVRDIYSIRQGTSLQKRTILTRGYLLQVDADEWPPRIRRALARARGLAPRTSGPEIRTMKEGTVRRWPEAIFSMTISLYGRDVERWTRILSRRQEGREDKATFLSVPAIPLLTRTCCHQCHSVCRLLLTSVTRVMYIRKYTTSSKQQKTRGEVWFLARILNGTSTFLDKSLRSFESSARVQERKSDSFLENNFCATVINRGVQGKKEREKDKSEFTAFVLSFLCLYREKMGVYRHLSPSRMFCDCFIFTLFILQRFAIDQNVNLKLEEFKLRWTEIKAVYR